ncbi:MAG: ATP-binding protein [Schwartzia sp.]|nr:ATP-binding protein [Schwartzia sp. (in: firmicutes)]
MLQRIRCLERIRPFYDSDRIKIISGVRHAGKSVLMGQIRDELEARGKKTLYVDFADPATASECRDAQSLFTYIATHWKRRTKRSTCYLFLDSVQHLARWSVICRALTLSAVSLFVAGNGAPLLTAEAAKNLDGQYVEFRVRPFVYKELRAYAAELGKKAPVKDYLMYGGFPKRLECASRAATLRYLRGLDAEALRDVVVGCNIRKEEIFRCAADFVLSNSGQTITAHAVHSCLQEADLDCSVNTAMKYLSHLEAACLVRRLPIYSARVRRAMETYARFYDEDVAFHTLRKPQGDAALAANMKTIVCNELSAMGYTLSAYEQRSGSIDFLAEKDGRAYWVQVAGSIMEKDKREKELRLLNKLDNSRKKLIITNDEEDYSTSVVEHIRLKDFLMMEDLRG